MPKCLMAKKWKSVAAEKSLRNERFKLSEENNNNNNNNVSIIKANPNPVVRSTSSTGGNGWGPSSPTEGATAPSVPSSPPPGQGWLPLAPTAGKVTVLFNGKFVSNSPSLI